MSYKFEEDEFPLRTFGERDWGDTSRLLYHGGYGTAPPSSQRGRVAPKRRWTDSLPRDGPIGGREERTTFLDHVVLDPGWEATHPPKDMIGFTMNETIEHMRQNPPPDRHRAVFLILLLHGVAITLPWNMIITAQTYFEDYKMNATGVTKPDYRYYYATYSTLSFQVPMVLLNVINMIVQRSKGPCPTWTVVSLLSLVGLLIGSVVLAMLDSNTWLIIFFGVTMGIVLLLGSVYMNNIFGLAAIFPKNYTSAVVMGTTISGVLSSVATISSIAISPGVKISAIYFFLTAIILLLVVFDTFFALPYLKFYRHYRAIVAMKLSANAGAVIKEKRKRPLLHTFKQVWAVALSVWLVYFSSSAVYPAMMENTRKIDPNFPVPDPYWTPVFGYLTFPVFAVLGNMVTFLIRKPGAQFLWIASLLRTVLSIPYFLLCNYRAETRSLSILINNDYAFFAGGAVFGLSHGYLGALGMMYGPTRVETEHASTAGMIQSMVLTLGILCGTNFSLVVKLFVENVGAG